MKVAELGEFGLIDLLAKMVTGSPSSRLILGIGDDAAAWQAETATQLVTTDSLFQDVHFSLQTTSWEDLGWKSLAASLSDIAAMGGRPEYALVSLGLPGHIEVDDVVALYRGMIDIGQRFGAVIIGGDTCRASIVSITITVLGATGRDDRRLLTRSAARHGDGIAVTGSLGASAGGLEMLANQLHLDTDTAADLKNAHLRPLPRVAEGQVLLRRGVRAAIDISDGLVADLHHVCRASRAGARVEVEKIPVHPAVKAAFGDKALDMALSGGEDYELLFTAPAEIIRQIKGEVSCPVTVIGEIRADPAVGVSLVDATGNPVELTRTGWEHFTAK